MSKSILRPLLLSAPAGLACVANRCVGNVWEWCWDRWDFADYPAGAAVDPTGLEAGSGRALRGGSWGHGAGNARAASRSGFDPSDRAPAFGFRPVRTVP